MTPAEHPLPQAEICLTIPFHDVDMMHIVWHGHYVRYLEIARCALLDELDYNYNQMRDSGYGWPVIDMTRRSIEEAAAAIINLFNDRELAEGNEA